MAVQHQRTDIFQLRVEDCGKRLIDSLSRTSDASLTQHKWLDLLINRTISDSHFRIQALRFIDVLPSLNNDQSLAEHLQEYFNGIELPRFAEWGLKHSDMPWATRIAAPTVRYTLRGLARKFMGGAQLHQALTSISRLRQQKINFTLDLLGEATISDSECHTYQQQYLSILDSLAEPVSNWQEQPLLDISHGHPSPRLNLSIKLSSLYSQIRSHAPHSSIQAICKMLRPVLRSAIQHNAFITIDMEQYDLKHIVLGCFRQIIMEEEFKNWPHFGLAIQAYLKTSYEDIQQLITLLKQRGVPVTIRLVRGAYWDYETVIAKQNNWACPVWENKNDTDFNYEQCLTLLLSSHHIIYTAIATHNLRSIAYAMALTEQLNLKQDQYEFQMLYGMADTLQQALVNLNFRLRSYIPFGDTLPGMAYLVRRLLENSSGQNMLEERFNNSVSGFSNYSFHSPIPTHIPLHLLSTDKDKFINTPLLRFTDINQRQSFSNSLEQTRLKLGATYPLIVGATEIFTDNTINSYNPANPTQLIGKTSIASHTDADNALRAASNTFPEWSQTPVQQRADYLRRVANLLRDKRMEFSAWQIMECGKNWTEADADVCEAIDFLNYYAQQAELLYREEKLDVNGESNKLYYKPLGVSLVIAPWNFPLAILCGMLSASIVTGNTCILKPSSLSPVVAAQFIKLWRDVGLPDGVINYLPGPGKIIGEYLAAKENLHIITFTGSLQVGTQLLNIGAQIQPGQQHIKRVLAEMGGKNAIIIDKDADLDDAVSGTVQSAFGFQGQKCSAASRVIVVAELYKRFTERLLEATKSLTIGDPALPENFIGPVIDDIAYSRILQTIDNAKKTARLHTFETNIIPDTGHFIFPCIFTDVDPESPLAQEEIFGPVLAVIKADDFKHAVELANNTRYALTGGVYSRQPSHIQYAQQHFNVGNLYINRTITGAVVNRHPFGGFSMSGTGIKTGGSEYLKQFLHAYCVSENTLRRGFAPELD